MKDKKEQASGRLSQQGLFKGDTSNLFDNDGCDPITQNILDTFEDQEYVESMFNP